MSPEDFLGDSVERLEFGERSEPDSPAKRMRQITRRTALTGGAAGIAAVALQACGGSSKKTANTGTGSASAASGSSSSVSDSIFGSHPKYHFVMVNHVTTNTFFTPTQSGAADACKLLGCSYQWTGSPANSASVMVQDINNAVAQKVAGIATTLISETAFNAPVKKAMDAGIPVVSYNSDVPSVDRLAYIGQDLYEAGVQLGEKIVGLVPSGEVGMFIATPGSLNIQPRMNGALSVIKKHSGIKADVVTSGAAIPQELTTINSWASSHSSAKGMFAVDAGSTQSLGQVLLKQKLTQKGWKGGGFDLTPITQKLINAGTMEFTIDQQPYLQGFLPILQLFMYNVSQKLTGPATTDTGLKFVTKSTVGPYVSTKSEYEGTSTTPGVQKA